MVYLLDGLLIGWFLTGWVVIGWCIIGAADLGDRLLDVPQSSEIVVSMGRHSVVAQELLSSSA